MAKKYQIFLNDDIIQQFIVNFAFRTPIRKELTGGERKSLGSVLKDLDPSFQLFDQPSGGPPGLLYQVLHEVLLGSSIATMPSFVMSNNSFSFICPIKVTNLFVKGNRSFDTADRNRKMADWANIVQSTISNLSCSRTGKIFELVLGPFDMDRKKVIFKNLFAFDLSAAGEVQFTFANYRNINNVLYNIQNNVRYLQKNLSDRFFVSIRIDINNRNLSSTMEPTEMQVVWKVADSIIKDHLPWILAI